VFFKDREIYIFEMAKENPDCNCTANAIVFDFMEANKETASKKAEAAFPLPLMNCTRKDLEFSKKTFSINQNQDCKPSVLVTACIEAGNWR